MAPSLENSACQCSGCALLLAALQEVEGAVIVYSPKIRRSKGALSLWKVVTERTREYWESSLGFPEAVLGKPFPAQA